MRAKLACAAVLVIMAAQTLAEEDKLEIKPFIKPGNYVIKVTNTSSMPSTGATTSQASGNFVTETILELAVSPADGSGQKWRISPKMLSYVAPGESGGKPALQERSTEGKWVELVLDSKAEVTQFELHDSSTQSVSQPSLEKIKKEANGQLGKWLPHVYLLTEKPVAVGATWDGIMVAEFLHTKCKLVKLTKDTAQIEGELSGNRNGMTMSGKQTIVYDRGLQAVTSSHMEMKVEQPAPPDMPQAQGRSSVSVSDITLKPGKYEASSKPASEPASKPAPEISPATEIAPDRK